MADELVTLAMQDDFAMATWPPMPDDDARKLASELMRKGQGRILAQANVIEGSGFWAGTARSVVAAMNFAAQIKYPVQVTPTIEEGAAFLSSTMGLGAADAASLQDACTRFRAAHGALGPAPTRSVPA